MNSVFSFMVMSLIFVKSSCALMLWVQIVEDLGGAVTADGSLCTHVLAVNIRKTLNFCTALCSGLA